VHEVAESQAPHANVTVRAWVEVGKRSMTGGLECGATGHQGPCVGVRGVFGWAARAASGEKKMGHARVW
jgi:hypothetical protein